MKALQNNGTQLAVHKSAGIDKVQAKSIETFQKNFLNKQPVQGEVQVNKFANNSLYLPISYVEMQLDEIFFGQWKTENFNFQVIANEIVGSIELVCVHPVTGWEIRRSGAASVQIQVRKGTDPMSVNNKIANTLVKDFPHLKASCLSNAAKSLGKVFGRDLNRKGNVDQYNPIVTPYVEKEIKSLDQQIANAQTNEELIDIFQTNQNVITSDTKLVKAYNTAKKQLAL